MPDNHGAHLKLRVFPDLEAMSRAAAAVFAEQAAKAAQARGRFSVVLSGGSTPRRTYEILGQPPLREQLPWDRTHVFWGDERCVPPGDPRSNARLAMKALLEAVAVPRAQVHPIRCHESPAAAAAQYETGLRSFFGAGPPRFDLVFLGLGENGHTASLFPHSRALAERRRWAVETYVAAQDLYRVTLTALVLNQAARVVFLVAGPEKAAVLKEVLEGPREPLRLPAQLLRPPDGEVLWLVDEAAASQLQRQ